MEKIYAYILSVYCSCIQSKHQCGQKRDGTYGAIFIHSKHKDGATRGKQNNKHKTTTPTRFQVGGKEKQGKED